MDLSKDSNLNSLQIECIRLKDQITHTHTFSPMIKANSVRIQLTIAIKVGWKLRQSDISNDFLHGRLEERIIVSQPFGFEDLVHPTLVCLFYGLKQSSRM